MRPVFATLPLALGIACAIPACSTATESERENERVAAARQETFDQYGAYVDETTSRYFACLDELEATGTCVVTDSVSKRSVRVVLTGPRTTDWRERFQRAREVGSMVRQLLRDAKGKMCETVAPFARLQRPYFFYGGEGSAGVGAAANGGAAVYFDLYNQQAAVFNSVGYSAGTTSGVEVGAYMGYAFGNQPNVIAAGSGRTCSVSGALGIKAIAGVSVTGQVFSSPDGNLVGAAVGISASAGFFEVPVDVNVGVSDSGAWNGATQALGNNGWGYRSDIITDGATGDQYVQYAGAVDMAIAMLWNVPPPQSVAVATQILALAALKETGLTIEQACPDEVAAVPPPDIGVVGEACEALPSLRPGSGDGGGDGQGTPGGGDGDGGPAGPLDPTDCGDKTDGWWCFGQGGAYMAYCKDKQIAGGCGCGSCTQGGVPAACSAPPPPAACPN